MVAHDDGRIKRDREEIKRVVTEHDGHVRRSAEALGISEAWLSQLLNHRLLCVWWRHFKDKRTIRRAYERGRRKRERQKALEASRWHTE